jgi:hypothetical protein
MENFGFPKVYEVKIKTNAVALADESVQRNKKVSGGFFARL